MKSNLNHIGCIFIASGLDKHLINSNLGGGMENGFKTFEFKLQKTTIANQNELMQVARVVKRLKTKKTKIIPHPKK